LSTDSAPYAALAEKLKPLRRAKAVNEEYRGFVFSLSNTNNVMHNAKILEKVPI
jgi:hypothetical protein